MARVGEGLEVGADGFDVHPCSRHALHLGVRGAAPSRDQRLRDLVNATPRSRCTTAKSIAQATQLAYLCALALGWEARLAPLRLPVSRAIFLCIHAAAIAPAGSWRMKSFNSLTTAAFPEILPGRLPHLGLSRPARRSRTLRPAYSLSRQKRPVASKAPTISLPPSPLRLLPAGTTVAGRDLHPLKMHAFARRTE